MDKHTLSSYYIVEIEVPIRQNDLLFKTDLKRNDKMIPFIKEINWETNTNRIEFLTVCYKNKDAFICLHNGKICNQYIKNMVPLGNVLPKVSYNIPSELSIKECLKIFNSLFKENNIFNNILYNNNDVAVDKIYVGTLKFWDCYGNSQKCYFNNIPEKCLLIRNNAKIINVNDYKNNTEFCEYEYNTFECLVFKNNNQLLNLHNNQYYPKFNLESYSNSAHSSYLKLLPFSEYLENKNIKYKNSEISIPKALKLYKK